MVTLVPTSGICNRMRAIDSAIAFCKKHNKKLKIIWVRDPNLNSPFSALFNPIESENVKLHEASKLPYYLRIISNRNHILHGIVSNLMFNKVILAKDFQNLFDSDFDFNSIGKSGKVFISSYSRFYENKDIYSQFKPIDSLQQIIEERSKDFTPNTIGVHIRRTDHQNSIKYSPTELFVEKMNSEIEKNQETNFFVASDSFEVKEMLEQRFSGRIITFYNETQRDSIEGIQEGVLDLYCLSKTRKILGSYFSSFSHTAAHISGILEETVKIEE